MPSETIIESAGRLVASGRIEEIPTRTYSVPGSKIGVRYLVDVVLDEEGGKAIKAYCRCKAGEAGRECKHALAAMFTEKEREEAR